MQQLENFIKKIQIEKKIQHLNEEATKMSIIIPILQKLGWDVFDNDEVSPEFSVENGRVDYSLRNSHSNKVFIEVKKTGEDLDKHQEQLLTYSFHAGVSLAILTNGVIWWLYLPLQEGSWEQRKFYAIDMYAQEYDKITSIFSSFLEKTKVFNGDALKGAKQLYGNKQKKDIIKKNIPLAWHKLHSDSDDFLVELIAETTEKMCGYKPENHEISNFLKSVSIKNLNINRKRNQNITYTQNTTLQNQKSKEDILYTLDDKFTGTKPSAVYINGKLIEVADWKTLYINVLSNIAMLNSQNFAQIVNISGTKKKYFSKNKQGLSIPMKIKNTSFYAATHFSADNIIKLLKRVFTELGHDKNIVKIKLKK